MARKCPPDAGRGAEKGRSLYIGSENHVALYIADFLCDTGTSLKDSFFCKACRKAVCFLRKNARKTKEKRGKNNGRTMEEQWKNNYNLVEIAKVEGKLEQCKAEFRHVVIKLFICSLLLAGFYMYSSEDSNTVSVAVECLEMYLLFYLFVSWAMYYIRRIGFIVWGFLLFVFSYVITGFLVVAVLVLMTEVFHISETVVLLIIFGIFAIVILKDLYTIFRRIYLPIKLHKMKRR